MKKTKKKNGMRRLFIPVTARSLCMIYVFFQISDFIYSIHISQFTEIQTSSLLSITHIFL